MQGLTLHPDDIQNGTKTSLTWKRANDNWLTARQSAEHELSLGDTAAMWAHTTLIEVELWKPVFTDHEGEPKRHLDALLSLTDGDSFSVRSTYRQLRRYLDWWLAADYTPMVDSKMKDRINELLEHFPENVETEEELLELSAPTVLESVESVLVLDPNEQLGSDRVVPVSLDDEQHAPSNETPFFRVQMLPARAGDALWIEYGQGRDLHRVLIDGGYRKTIQSVERRIRDIARKEGGVCKFDLVVVTHIDVDHIEGIIELLGAGLPIEIEELWFNGRRHHPNIETSTRLTAYRQLSGKHGLFLDTLIDRLDARWNSAFNGGPVIVPAEPSPLPMVELPGGMKITLLSPTHEKLAALAPEWDKHIQKAGLDHATSKEVLQAMENLHYRTAAVRDMETLRRERPTGPINMDDLITVADTSDPGEENGASIAFLAEFDGRSVLFTGDSHADVLINSIRRLTGGGRLRVGAVKLVHHGNRNNVSAALLEKLNTQTFLVSTNGATHFHPDREAIARVVAGEWRGRQPGKIPIRLLFNYVSDFTGIWNNKELKEKYTYEVFYPDAGDVLELSLVPRT